MNLGLLVCDHVDTDLRAEHGGYVDMFRALFRTETEVHISPYDLRKGDWPRDAKECDAWITTGSRYSVNDEVGWIVHLHEFVRQAVAAAVPFVGICFGHQMLAKALGGSVSGAKSGWAVGIHKVRFLKPDTGSESALVVYSHSEAIGRLPKSAMIVGESPHCPTAVVRFAPRALGIQGHPEMTSEYARTLLERRRGSLIPEATVSAGLATFEHNPNTSAWLNLIVEFIHSA